jgi:hypothetical protein
MKKYNAVEFIRYDKKLPVMKEWENGVTAHTAQFARVFMRGIFKEMEQQGHSLRAE